MHAAYPAPRRSVQRRRGGGGRHRERLDLGQRLERPELDHHHDVRHGDGQVLVALRAAVADKPADLDVGEGEELALVAVEEVGGAGAVALARELHGPFDLVTLGLDPNALAAIVHKSQYRPPAPSAL